MSELIPAFRDSVFSPLSGPASDFIEIGIDAIFDNDALKSIPFVSTVVGLCKVGVNIHERNLLRQTAIFIEEFNNGNIDIKRLEKYRKELEENPEKAEKELGRVLILLGKQIDEIQSKVLGSFYNAHVKGSVSWEKFCELTEANSRMFAGDYDILREASIESGLNINGRELYQIDRLISLGLLKNQQRLGSGLGSYVTVFDENLSLHDPMSKDVMLTSFGQTFCQLMPKTL
jgi:hypothetical protein